MTLLHRLTFPVMAISAISATVCLAQEQDELGKRLGAMQSLRKGVLTPLDAVEKESAALLKEYTKPEEQGRIYYFLADSYGQAGMSLNGHANKVIEYLQKALDCPLDPALRLRLYVYWGGAIVLSDPTEPIYFSRAAAATAYLKGLNEAKKYNIPEVRPERPPFSMPKVRSEEEFRREQQARYQQLKRIEYARDMYGLRSGLENQVIGLYSRRPYAASELRKLAKEILGDDPQVDKLMTRLEAQGALKDEPQPKGK